MKVKNLGMKYRKIRIHSTELAQPKTRSQRKRSKQANISIDGEADMPVSWVFVAQVEIEFDFVKGYLRLEKNSQAVDIQKHYVAHDPRRTWVTTG
jgi:hypothetical protein